ncbi:TRAP transporter small permease [Pararhodobacter zhoushanensis]|uniref:TRAP transporter small permease protein n=1 Tax=Pararhodobacter zhoushanensis TaxID=2479545 RepID=A0ABT3H5K3_9RHOB|nr:TRAP transporter small permease [Pararhodobacter zhoushanensis]MCW1935020.1 TRAP transporter small permease [Pararhodobacter zhoushanensis]
MTPLFDRFHATTTALNRWVRRVAGLLFALMLLIMLFQVAARYIFSSPPVWSEELARWLMVWGGLLGASVAFHTHADPAMVKAPLDSLRRQKIQAVARLIAAFGFFLPVLWYSWPFLLRQINQPSEGMQISSAWMVSALPVAAILICLHALAGLGAVWSPRIRAAEIEKQRQGHGDS